SSDALTLFYTLPREVLRERVSHRSAAGEDGQRHAEGDENERGLAAPLRDHVFPPFYLGPTAPPIHRVMAPARTRIAQPESQRSAIPPASGPAALPRYLLACGPSMSMTLPSPSGQ